MANEKRLIERIADRMKDAYPQADRNNLSPAIYYDDFSYIVDEVLEDVGASVDAVEVVLCKDCRYWENGDCYRLELSRQDDFCSYGERKDCDD